MRKYRKYDIFLQRETIVCTMYQSFGTRTSHLLARPTSIARECDTSRKSLGTNNPNN